MFRRCVSLLVIAGFIASQLAAIPHAHGAASAEQQREHDATPHFHWGWLGHADDDHGHSNSGHGHSHPGQEISGGSEPPSDGSEGQPLGTGLSSSDHDADAFFIPKQAASASSAKNQLVSAWQFAALAPPPDWIGDLQASEQLSVRWHPPDEVLDGSDRYLTLRNLRI